MANRKISMSPKKRKRIRKRAEQMVVQNEQRKKQQAKKPVGKTYQQRQQEAAKNELERHKESIRAKHGDRAGGSNDDQQRRGGSEVGPSVPAGSGRGTVTRLDSRATNLQKADLKERLAIGDERPEKLAS
jgi:hypothetical protein